ncbi:MAG: hypothetical protein Q7N50_06980 [Armatimonadota bacterium]|nr:hypothetical protein [Armatimonadota bacterium]
MEKFSRDYLDERCIGSFRTAKGTRPDLKLIDLDGSKTVLKDFHHSDPWFRAIVGPILIRREYGALQKLAEVDGIPELCGMIDRHALLMSHVDGVPLRDLELNAMGLEFYDQLEDLVSRMHAAGVAHCDLRTGTNVLVDKDGKPNIIDFASCVFRGRGLNPFIRFIFREFQRADLFATLLLKKRMSPALLTAEDEAAIARSLPFERAAIFIGKSIRNLVRGMLTRR